MSQGPAFADWRRVTLHWVAVPLLRPFGAAHGTETTRQVVVVEAEATDGVVGWGECDALARPTYTHEYTAGAYALLRDELVPAWLSGSFGPARWHPMAAAALDCAAADAAARRAGRSVAAMLGSSRRCLPRTAVVGQRASVDALVAAVDDASSGGASLVKLKLGTPADREALAAVRSALPHVALAADANGAFAGLAPRDLAWVDELELRYLEQPYPADDLLATAALARAVATPIALDESISSLPLAQVAQALGALAPSCLVNVKVARLGGLERAAAVARWAAGEGIAVFCGGMLELGVGRAAALALAAGDDFSWPTDLGPSAQYVAQDLTEPIVVDEAGRVVVPDAPGIGVVPDPARLAASTVATATIGG